MTVAELIKELSEYPADKEVLIKGELNGTFGDVRKIREGAHSSTKGKVCITAERF